MSEQIPKSFNENAEKKIKLEWSGRQSASWGRIKFILEQPNSEIEIKGEKWRLPTKDELVEAIKNGEINNGGPDNITRWSWTGTKVEGEEEARVKRSSGFHESQLMYVVKFNGEVDNAALYEYGLRLVRVKK